MTKQKFKHFELNMTHMKQNHMFQEIFLTLEKEPKHQREIIKDHIILNNIQGFYNLMKKNKNATNVALMVMHKVLAKLNNINNNKYLNFSVKNCFVGDAPVALRVMHQSNKLGPSGHPSSILGWGATYIL